MRQKSISAALGLLAILGLLGAGCASVIDVHMPAQFAKKKLKEDAPPDATLINNDLGLPKPEPKH